MTGFGAAARAAFALEDGFLTVNHGSFGATPRAVLAAQEAWRARMEAQPTRFMALEHDPALAAAGVALGRFLGADPAGLAFLDNATTGCNAVLRSVGLAAGDEVVLLGHAYGAVRKAAGVVAAAAGARVVEAALPFPRPDETAVLESLAAALSPRTRLAVLDHIPSPSALVLPLAAMLALCRARGVPVLVDGAHGPGQVPLALDALGADWYVGNCHKWLFAPKGCGFLFTAPARRASTHPLVVSHGLGQGYAVEFGWTGTRDPTAFLAIEAAIAAHAGFPGMMERNRALAAEAAAMLAARWGTEIGARPEMQGSMAVVRLPCPGTTPEDAMALRRRLLAAGADAPVSALPGGLWLRLSAAAYNAAEDYHRLAELVARLLAAA